MPVTDFRQRTAVLFIAVVLGAGKMLSDFNLLRKVSID